MAIIWVVREGQNLKVAGGYWFPIAVGRCRGWCRPEETLSEGPAGEGGWVVAGCETVDEVGEGSGVGGGGGEEVETAVERLVVCGGEGGKSVR